MEDSPLLPCSSESFISSAKAAATSQELANEKLLTTISELKQDAKKLNAQVKESREKLLKSEERSHEYYELYYNLLYDQRKTDHNAQQISKENIHLKNQLELIQRYVGKLERKLANRGLNLGPNQEKESVCEFEVEENRWGSNFIVISK